MSALAPTLEAYFTHRLISQKRASRHTIAAYRDAFRLLLHFAEQQTGKAPSLLGFEDLDAPLIGAFLDHLEHARATPPRAGTPGWQPSTHCSASPCSATPSTPPSSPACWPYQPNAATAATFRSSPTPSAKPSSPPPTATAGPVGATTP